MDSAGWQPDLGDFSDRCRDVLRANQQPRPRPFQTLPPEHYEAEQADEAIEVRGMIDHMEHDE